MEIVALEEEGPKTLLSQCSLGGGDNACGSLWGPQRTVLDLNLQTLCRCRKEHCISILHWVCMRDLELLKAFLTYRFLMLPFSVSGILKHRWRRRKYQYQGITLNVKCRDLKHTSSIERSLPFINKSSFPIGSARMWLKGRHIFILHSPPILPPKLLKFKVHKINIYSR